MQLIISPGNGDGVSISAAVKLRIWKLEFSAAIFVGRLETFTTSGRN